MEETEPYSQNAWHLFNLSASGLLIATNLSIEETEPYSQNAWHLFNLSASDLLIANNLIIEGTLFAKRVTSVQSSSIRFAYRNQLEHRRNGTLLVKRVTSVQSAPVCLPQPIWASKKRNLTRKTRDICSIFQHQVCLSQPIWAEETEPYSQNAWHPETGRCKFVDIKFCKFVDKTRSPKAKNQLKVLHFWLFYKLCLAVLLKMIKFCYVL